MNVLDLRKTITALSQVDRKITVDTFNCFNERRNEIYKVWCDTQNLFDFFKKLNEDDQIIFSSQILMQYAYHFR